VCHSVLEASFFPAIVSLLTTVYRCKNYRDEATLAEKMSRYVNASPRDLAVRRKYWLIEQVKGGKLRFPLRVGPANIPNFSPSTFFVVFVLLHECRFLPYPHNYHTFTCGR